jgi:Domain of unknown function (DUF4202)
VDSVESRARAAIDAAHGGDPEAVGGRAAEASYADQIEAWVSRLSPAPGLALRLAARAQHLERWSISRSQFPEGRGGYLRWRAAVHRRQGERLRGLIAAAGGDAPLAARAASLVAKATPRDDPEAQLLEDAACLVFLEAQLPDFLRHHGRAKVVDVLRKTWKKMSPLAQGLALGLPMTAEARDFVREALG